MTHTTVRVASSGWSLPVEQPTPRTAFLTARTVQSGRRRYRNDNHGSGRAAPERRGFVRADQPQAFHPNSCGCFTTSRVSGPVRIRPVGPHDDLATAWPADHFPIGRHSGGEVNRLITGQYRGSLKKRQPWQESDQFWLPDEISTPLVRVQHAECCPQRNSDFCYAYEDRVIRLRLDGAVHQVHVPRCLRYLNISIAEIVAREALRLFHRTILCEERIADCLRRRYYAPFHHPTIDVLNVVPSILYRGRSWYSIRDVTRALRQFPRPKASRFLCWECGRRTLTRREVIERRGGIVWFSHAGVCSAQCLESHKLQIWRKGELQCLREAKLRLQMTRIQIRESLRLPDALE